MDYRLFEVTNFRGIQQLKLDLGIYPKSKIFTLVGLNESGKSTILEAINFFHYKKSDLESLELKGYKINDIHNLVPISKRSNFNEPIILKVGLTLDEEDEISLKEFCQNELEICLTEPVKQFAIKQIYSFKDSRYCGKVKYEWNISLIGKRKRAKSAKKLEGEDWHKAIGFLQSRIPNILYFPNFMFDFPEKIYLEDDTDEKQKFYRLVIQDILDVLGNGTNVQTHILERIKSDRQEDQNSLRDLLLQMGRNVSKTVFSAWYNIFNREIGDQQIKIDYSNGEDGPYLEFRLEDSDGYFLISERSLGFRWFFVFLLITQYRGFRKNAPKNTLFLFDEPASNLHSTAQAQLLESLERLSQNCKIIYTTHSQYLINPKWLESTFVVKNEGLEYDKQDQFSAKYTNIKIHRYRDFAVNHPDQSSYFKPILDVLDFAPSKLELIPNVVIVEGKYDFYNIHYMQEVILCNMVNGRINLLPGMGASQLDNIIRLYIAWGGQFIVLLDGDHEGKIQVDRYNKEFGVLVKNRIFTLGDIKGEWYGSSTEGLYRSDELLFIQKTCYPDSDIYNKKLFNQAIQELMINKQSCPLSKETTDNFHELLLGLKKRLNNSLKEQALVS